MTEKQQDTEPLPLYVNFKTGANLLVKLGLVEHMTRQGLRKISLTDPNWPFGENDYLPMGRALAMQTDRLIEFFESRTERN
ncbi:hypothetical protein [Streptomyces sp. N35]|uniref:hypothetical protein n=1 Tax=Streptomyces sp. N35 TaxID=2795730 RepID=UPI0018F74355|nr:hypothetical protein [Streptomyces sp. N35]